MYLARRLTRKTLGALSLGFALLLSPLSFAPALAGDETFQLAVRQYNSGHYANAKTLLQSAEREMPYDPRPLYYQALLEQRLGHSAGARSIYQKIVDKFPDTDAAEMAKKGLGMITFGSGYDRPGGSLSKLDKLRMDVIPQELALNCQERDGKPVVVATVDGKKVSFLIDPTSNNSFIGSDLVRSNVLNDRPVLPVKRAASKPPAKAVAKEPVKDATKAPAGDASKPAVTDSARAPVTDSAKAPVTDSAKAPVADSAKSSVADTAKSPVTDSAKASATDTAKAPILETPKTAATEPAKDAAKADDKVVPSATKSASPDQVAAVNPVRDADVVLYDLVLGTIQRPAFPMFISKIRPTEAVLGRDFLGPYKVTFNATAKTLNLVRDHSYENPFAAAMSLFNKGKYKQSLPLFKRTIANRTADPRPLYCYAQALQRCGDLESAKTIYRQVLQRFPDGEASYYASIALNDIDPAYARERTAKNQTEEEKKKQVSKTIETFDIPYSMEGTDVIVTAYVDNLPVPMIMIYQGNNLIFSSNQLSAIDPNYLSDLQLVSTVTDNTNMMNTVVTKTGFLKFLRLGKIEKFRVPMTVIDQGPLKFLASWQGTSLRPMLPMNIMTGWQWQVMTDLKVIRFTKIPGQS